MKDTYKRFVLMMMLLMLMYVGMIGFWATDISAGAIASGVDTISILGVQDPYFTYHLGLLMASLSFFMMAILAAWGISRK